MCGVPLPQPTSGGAALLRPLGGGGTINCTSTITIGYTSTILELLIILELLLGIALRPRRPSGSPAALRPLRGAELLVTVTITVGYYHYHHHYCLSRGPGFS